MAAVQDLQPLTCEQAQPQEKRHVGVADVFREPCDASRITSDSLPQIGSPPDTSSD